MQMHTGLHFSPSNAQRPGTNIRLLDLVDSGGSGTVFRALRSHPHATEAGTEEIVAIKFPNSKGTLADEAAALQMLKHPNIVELLEDHTRELHGELAGALVIELCQDGTVEDLVFQRALDASEVHLVVTAIGSALEAIHAQGWIHGDVNPSNIGLRSDADPALFDLGACRPADGTATTEDTLGTIEFAQPQLPNSPVFDIRSLAATALWALGDVNEFSPNDQRVAGSLTQLIAACDAGAQVSLTDLYAAFDGVAAVRPIVSSRPTASKPHANHQLGARTRDTGPLAATSDHSASRPAVKAGGPGNPSGPERPRTRRFGPGAGGGDGDEPGFDRQSTPNGFAKKVAVLVGAFALASLMGIEIFGQTPHASADAPAVAALVVADDPEGTLIEAGQTLLEHGVQWSSDNGSATFDLGGVATTFYPGLEGDLAAVGDWNCDGLATLGVFRPSTGTWFAFDSWTADSTSTVERITGAATTQDLVAQNLVAQDLAVVVDAQGCAAPYLR